MAVAGGLKRRRFGVFQQSKYLDVDRERPYSAPMINAATIAIARRRRTIAVWADVCV
jgi:hypothetical protein